MSDLLKFTVKTIGLDAELKNEMSGLKKQSVASLTSVGADMAESLKRHIQNDWYNAYKPAVYERRTDDASLGTPIGSDDNFDISVDHSNTRLDFYFEPDRENRKFDILSPTSDAMIEWIQREHKYGEVRRGTKFVKEASLVIPARPFWNNFVEEMANGGIIDSFIRNMSPQYQIKQDANDTNLNLAESYIKETIDTELFYK